MTGTGQGTTWDVLGDGNEVRAWSQVRLPFEPRGELLEYRTALRSALRRLSPPTSSVHGLIATYGSPNTEFVDVENVALYNIGAGSYSCLTSHGLICHRVDSPDQHHHLTYSVAELADPTPAATCLLAHTPEIDIPPGTAAPAQWWRLFAGRFTTTGMPHPHGDFALDVTLGGAWTGGGVAAVVKSLLDGLICALGHHDGSDGQRLRERLRPYGDPDALWTRLVDPSGSVLGACRLLHCHGPAGIAWNPADERCAAFRIRVAPGARQRVSAVVRTEVSTA